MKGQGINILDLNLWYGDFHAVKGVSLDIDPNRVTAFIGPSGCGKSTVLRCLNRMNDLIEDARIEGQILIDNQNIYAPDTDVYALRKKVGMVFQKPSPFPKTIFENVAYGLRVNGMRNKSEIADVVEHSLKGAALWKEVKEKLHQSALGLSGGQQQRLCIARAIAPNPEVVLMDEPTSALDPISTVQVEELMAELKNKYTIVIVTHNMQQAQRIADKTAFYFVGHLIEYTDTHTLFNNPKEEKTQKYISGDFS
ncbi:MAG: phosphate ABC transporter ATP-binding protein PstB [Saprospiraceae bacterium]|jgi:phosphate transport system ATP-binding protein